MHNKVLYILIGVLIGVIIMFAMTKIPNRLLYAMEESGNLNSGSSDGVIAITTNTLRTRQTILWVLDVKKGNLLVYEYEDGTPNRLRLVAFRDIEYDIDIPHGYSGFEIDKGHAPLEVKQAFDDARKKLTPSESPKK
jgi:hypothetical protein